MFARGLPLLAAAALLAAGCSKPDQAADQAATPPAPPNTVHIMATDYAFEMPDTLPSGVTTFHLMNNGKETHHVVIAKMAMADLQKMFGGPPPADLVLLGGPNAAPPGGNAEATVDLEPGTYTVFCVIPAADGQPHVMKGMARSLTVTQGSSTAVMPAADITVKLADYSFDVTGPLTAGPHVIRVENSAAQMHEMIFVKLEPGKTVQQAAAWLEKPDGPPPASLVYGVSPMTAGKVNVVSVTLAPGEYGMICFAPDSKDQKPHSEHGMIKQFTVN